MKYLENADDAALAAAIYLSSAAAWYGTSMLFTTTTSLYYLDRIILVYLTLIPTALVFYLRPRIDRRPRAVGGAWIIISIVNTIILPDFVLIIGNILLFGAGVYIYNEYRKRVREGLPGAPSPSRRTPHLSRNYFKGTTMRALIGGAVTIQISLGLMFLFSIELFPFVFGISTTLFVMDYRYLLLCTFFVAIGGVGFLVGVLTLSFKAFIKKNLHRGGTVWAAAGITLVIGSVFTLFVMAIPAIPIISAGLRARKQRRLRAGDTRRRRTRIRTHPIQKPRPTRQEDQEEPTVIDRRATPDRFRCLECGEVIRGGEAICPECGAEQKRCIVCHQFIGQEELYVACHHCEQLAHRAHLLEWLKGKRTCPYCRKKLRKSDVT